MGERRVQQQQTPRRAAREGRAVLRRFSHGVVACMVTLMAGDVAVSQVTTVGTSPGGQVMEVVGDGIVAGELGEEEDATAGAERGDAGEVGDGVVIATSQPVSGAGGTNEEATMIEAPENTTRAISTSC